MNGLEPIQPQECVLEVHESQHFPPDPTIGPTFSLSERWIVFRLEVIKRITLNKSRNNLEQSRLEGVTVVLLV